MPPERFPPDDPREWLRRADSNLVQAKRQEAAICLEDLCFQAQQAAEKSLKALLLARQPKRVTSAERSGCRISTSKIVIVTACSTSWPFNWLFNQTRSVVSRIKEVCRYSGIKIIAILVCPGAFGNADISGKYLERARKIGKHL